MWWLTWKLCITAHTNSQVTVDLHPTNVKQQFKTIQTVPTANLMSPWPNKQVSASNNKCPPSVKQNVKHNAKTQKQTRTCPGKGISHQNTRNMQEGNQSPPLADPTSSLECANKTCISISQILSYKQQNVTKPCSRITQVCCH